MSLFKNFKSFDKPVKNHVVRQAHPNVSPYRWIPNSPFHKITQPHEKGSFFTVSSDPYKGSPTTPNMFEQEKERIELRNPSIANATQVGGGGFTGGGSGGSGGSGAGGGGHARLK